jgi:hypothetical protein
MHKQITILLLLLLPVFAQAQNLVPNGDFEYYTSCPTNASQTSLAQPWRQYHGATSDYFNVCTSSPNVGIPLSAFGYQYAASGNAHMGGYSYLSSSNLTGYTEYIAAPMAPMIIGATYEVSMSVSLSNTSQSGNNGLGIWFYDIGATSMLSGGGNGSLSITPQVSYASYGPITDTVNWVRVTTLFTADSAYDNLVIGKFTPSVGLAITTTSGTGTGSSYYYFDSIVVKLATGINNLFTDSMICAGDAFPVPYTINNTILFTSTNVFSAQLSNSSGNFNGGTTIVGTVVSNTAGFINCVTPPSVIPGNKYRIRILSSSNVDSSKDNGKDITISAYPIPFAGSNSPVCEGDSLKLSASSFTPASSFFWTGPNTNSAAGNKAVRSKVQLLDSGSYIVQATYNGCVAYDTVQVHVKPLPTKPTLLTNAPVCEDDSLHLVANSITASSYTWTGANMFTGVTNDTVIKNTTVAASGEYIVTAWLLGCKDTTSVNVVIKPRPRPQIITLPGICEGDTLIFDVNQTVVGEQYNWAGPNGFNATTKVSKRPFANQSMQGNYVVTVDANGCVNTDTIQITIKPLPLKPIAIYDSLLCVDDTLHLSANRITANTSYTWNGPDNFTSHQISTTISGVTLKASGVYIITADEDGCIQRDTATVLVKPLPEMPVINANSPLQTGQDLYLNLDNPQANVKYRWTGPHGFTSVVPNPVIYKPDTNSIGTYFLIAELNGCYNSNQLLVQIDQRADTGNLFLYPNPNNGDFFIKGVFKTDQQTPVHIFDGAGKLVYTNSFKTNNKKLFEAIYLKDYLASGEYSLHIMIDGKKRILRFTVIR